jgi:predicted PurR-regulated permease PerM
MTWQSSPARGGLSVTQAASGMALAALMIAFLFFGRAILEPLVIAALLAFILSPVIRRLRRLGLWRVPAVIVTVAGALGVLGALSATIVVQIAQLAEELPRYETNLRTKLRSIGGGTLTSGVIEGASGTLKKLEEEISSRSPEKAGQRPLPVEIREPQPTGLSALANLVRPLLSPLATTALVILFLLFILLQREDLRDRFLRLAGTADLQRSTAALDDAGSRLSRFFLLQTMLNSGFGLLIGVGLWLIGVPNPVLWEFWQV